MLEVKVYQAGGFWYAESSELVIVGTGHSREEAIADFHSLVAHFRNYYKNLPDSKLTGAAKRLKKLYVNMEDVNNA